VSQLGHGERRDFILRCSNAKSEMTHATAAIMTATHAALTRRCDSHHRRRRAGTQGNVRYHDLWPNNGIGIATSPTCSAERQRHPNIPSDDVSAQIFRGSVVSSKVSLAEIELLAYSFSRFPASRASMVRERRRLLQGSSGFKNKKSEIEQDFCRSQRP